MGDNTIPNSGIKVPTSWVSFPSLGSLVKKKNSVMCNILRSLVRALRSTLSLNSFTKGRKILVYPSFSFIIQVEIKGVVLLSVSLSREVVPGFARILLYTSLGKKHIVRPLLRTEITQVINRRAWYDATKLTAEVSSLYKVLQISIVTNLKSVWDM